MIVFNMTPNPVVLQLANGERVTYEPYGQIPKVVYGVFGADVIIGVIPVNSIEPEYVDSEPWEGLGICIVDETVRRALPHKKNLYYLHPENAIVEDGEVVAYRALAT